MWANRLLNAFLPELDAVFGTVYKNIGADAAWVARSWILKNTAAFIPVLEVWNTQYACFSPAAPELVACDFARLYTNIPHDDMLDMVMQLIHTAFQMPAHSNHTGIKIREKKHAVWLAAENVPAERMRRSGKDEGGAYLIYDLPMIREWLTFVLSNMFMQFGGKLRRQDIGAPMGTNCASNLANFYLAAYELRFLCGLLHVYMDHDQPAWARLLAAHVMKAFGLSGRFIDDLATINNLHLRHLMYEDMAFHHPLIKGIYPRSLELKVTMAGPSINYMDVTIGPVPDRQKRLATTLFDKRTVYPLTKLRIIRFPHISSHISDLAKYGIVVSQSHRFCSIIMRRSSFIHAVADVVQALHMNGYDAARMLALVKRQCRRHNELYGTLPRHLFVAIYAVVQAKVRQHRLT